MAPLPLGVLLKYVPQEVCYCEHFIRWNFLPCHLHVTDHNHCGCGRYGDATKRINHTLTQDLKVGSVSDGFI